MLVYPSSSSNNSHELHCVLFNIHDTTDPNAVKHVIIFIHGGGWVSGSESNVESTARLLVEMVDEDMVIACPSYSTTSLARTPLVSAGYTVTMMMVLALLVQMRTYRRITLLILLTIVLTYVLAELICLPEAIQHPTHVRDVALGVQQVANKFPNATLSLVGHSAGGHLAALLGTDKTYLDEVDVCYGRIICIVALDAVLSYQ